MVRRVGLALGVASVVWACGSATDAPRVTSTSVYDSLDVRITSQTLDPTKVLRLEEELRIGAIDGAEHEQFFQISDLALDDDGQLYVLDYGDHVIRVYGEDGTHLRSWGSEGQGPGEFTYPTSLAIARDTVVVGDLEFYHVFDTAGEHIQTMRNPRDRAAFVLEMGFWPATDGWRVHTFHADPDNPDNARFRISTYDVPLGAPGDIVYEYRPVEIETAEVPGSTSIAQPAFIPRSFPDVDPMGRVYHAPAAPYEIHVFAASGAASRILRPDWRRHIVTDDIMERYWQAQERRMCSVDPNGDVCRNYVDNVLPVSRGLPAPEFVPPIFYVLSNSDGDGGMLVRRRDVAEDLYAEDRPNVYDLFDGEDMFVGRFETSASFGAYVLHGEALYGIFTDELDVQYVVRYRIVS